MFDVSCELHSAAFQEKLKMFWLIGMLMLRPDEGDLLAAAGVDGNV